jgi:hypothetical protein
MVGAHGDSIHGTRQGPFSPQSWGVWTAKGPLAYPDKISIHILKPKDLSPIEFDRSIAWTPYLYGKTKTTPLKLTESPGGLVLAISKDSLAPIDAVIVLTHKSAERRGPDISKSGTRIEEDRIEVGIGKTACEDHLTLNVNRKARHGEKRCCKDRGPRSVCSHFPCAVRVNPSRDIGVCTDGAVRASAFSIGDSSLNTTSVQTDRKCSRLSVRLESRQDRSCIKREVSLI